MKNNMPRLLVLVALGAVVALSSGCATRKAKFGRETTVLGGLVETSTASYEHISPISIDVNTNDFAGSGNPTGNSTKILWGLITLHDY